MAQRSGVALTEKDRRGWGDDSMDLQDIDDDFSCNQKPLCQEEGLLNQVLISIK